MVREVMALATYYTAVVKALPHLNVDGGGGVAVTLASDGKCFLCN